MRFLSELDRSRAISSGIRPHFLHESDSLRVFTARLYAKAAYAVVACLSVRRPSVCHNHNTTQVYYQNGYTTRRITRKRHTIAHGLQPFDAKDLGKIPTGSPRTGVPNRSSYI